MTTASKCEYMRGYYRDNPAYAAASKARVKKWRAENPQRKREANNRSFRKQYAANPEKHKAKVRRLYRKNQENILARQKATRQTPEFKAKRRAYDTHRYATDSSFKVKKRIRERTRCLLRGVKSAPTLVLLGCSIRDLRAHLEHQFLPGMTWDNYGQWHIDHKQPCAGFNLLRAEEQRRCFHFTNLQPMWAVDNLKKGSKVCPA